MFVISFQVKSLTHTLTHSVAWTLTQLLTHSYKHWRHCDFPCMNHNNLLQDFHALNYELNDLLHTQMFSCGRNGFSCVVAVGIKT